MITDNQALVKEYSGSVPRKDQIEERIQSYVLKKFVDLVDLCVGTLGPNEKSQPLFAALVQVFESRNFPIQGQYFEMEVRRMEFDSFGRLKYAFLSTYPNCEET